MASVVFGLRIYAYDEGIITYRMHSAGMEEAIVALYRYTRQILVFSNILQALWLDAE